MSTRYSFLAGTLLVGSMLLAHPAAGQDPGRITGQVHNALNKGCFGARIARAVLTVLNAAMSCLRYRLGWNERGTDGRVRDRADRHLIPGQHSGQCVIRALLA